jgi:hypothetical protein
MTTPISFTIRPPSTAPARPSPLGNGSIHRAGSYRAGPPSRQAFQPGEDSDEEDGHARGLGNGRREQQGREEMIDGLGKGKGKACVRSPLCVKATDKMNRREPEQLIIAPLPNKDWRQSSAATKRPSYRPEVSHRNEPLITHERTGDEPQRSGLRFAVKTEITETDTDGHTVKVEESSPATIITLDKVEVDVKKEPLTLEEQALQAILAGDQHVDTAEDLAARELVISMGENVDGVRPADESDAFRRDVLTRPDESSLDDYASIPVSAFGLAIVRGMGYDPAKEKAISIPKARPHLLGIGATAMEAAPPPSRAAASKKKKEDYAKRGGRGYVPNLMIKRERDGREGSETTSANGNGSSRTSPAISDTEGRRRKRDDDEDRDGKRRDGRDGDGRRVKEEPRDRDRDRDTGRSSRDGRDSRRERETSRERSERKARERNDRGVNEKDGDGRRGDRYGERERETEEERAKRKAREREREKERDRRDYDDRDRRRRD